MLPDDPTSYRASILCLSPFLTELFSEAPSPTSIIMQCIFSHHMLSQLTIGLPCPILPLLNLLYNHCQSPLLCLNCGEASSTIRCHLIDPKIPTLVHSEEEMLSHPGLERGMNSTNSPDLLETPSVVARHLCTARFTFCSTETAPDRYRC